MTMLQETAEKALQHGKQFIPQGKVADYIPELGKVDPNQLGLCLLTTDKEKICCGDVDHRFTMQSVSKTATLAIALQELGFDEVFSHVMMEPSGDAFNSILKLDLASNRPYNPLLNAGAIEVISLLSPTSSFDELLSYIRVLCMDTDIVLDEDVYQSEYLTGNRNRAIGYLLKSKGVLQGDVLKTVDLYFKMCSLSVNARSLAGFGLILANGGIDPYSGRRILDGWVCRTVKTLMLTCGMYDGSGEFAVRVGIPAKSGVGGGIMASADNRMGIGVFGPSLDDKGNSISGIQALEYLSHELNLHIFESQR